MVYSDKLDIKKIISEADLEDLSIVVILEFINR
jgi:hypothetical protein